MVLNAADVAAAAAVPAVITNSRLSDRLLLRCSVTPWVDPDAGTRDVGVGVDADGVGAAVGDVRQRYFGRGIASEAVVVWGIPFGKTAARWLQQQEPEQGQVGGRHVWIREVLAF